MSYSDNGYTTYSLTFAYENWSVYDHGDAKNSSSLYDDVSDYFSSGEDKPPTGNTSGTASAPFTPGGGFQ